MRKGIKILIIVIVVIVLGLVVGGIILATSGDPEGLINTPIDNIDLSQVADGKYIGSYKSFPISVKVEVTVANHEITNIHIIRHFNGQGEAAEAITDIVIEEQSLQVDAIAGATYSSKVILLVIEDALKQ